MGIFTREESVDVLDLPDLERRGLLKLGQPREPNDDILDLVKGPSPSVTSPIPPPFSQPSGPNHNENSVGDFLNDFASIGAASSNPLVETKNNLVSDNSSDNNLTWRVENSEYKIEQLLERIAALEKKLAD